MLNPAGSPGKAKPPIPLERTSSAGSRAGSAAGASPRPVAAKPAGSGGGVSGGGGAGLTLAEMLESLEEGGLVDELLAEREADLQLEQIETDGVPPPTPPRRRRRASASHPREVARDVGEVQEARRLAAPCRPRRRPRSSSSKITKRS